MFIPASQLTHRTLHDAPGGSLMIDIRYSQILWIVGEGAERNAICLSDESAP